MKFEKLKTGNVSEIEKIYKRRLGVELKTS